MSAIRWTPEQLEAHRRRQQLASPKVAAAPMNPLNAAPQKAKPRKYRNEPTIIHGERFDSKGEATRYTELLDSQAAGFVTGLRRQVRYALTVEGQHIGDYVADFCYTTVVNGRRTEHVVEDFKSPASKTPLYEWKKKHLLAEHGVKIRETGKGA